MYKKRFMSILQDFWKLDEWFEYYWFLLLAFDTLILNFTHNAVSIIRLIHDIKYTIDMATFAESI